MLKSQNFATAARPGPHSNAVFLGRGQKIKIQLPKFCLPHCPNSEKVWHDPPAPKPWEEIDLAETPFLGVQAQPRGPLGPSHPPKNYLQRVKQALKILRGSVHWVKSWCTFLLGQTPRYTDAQTKMNQHSTIRYFFANLCGGRRETLQTIQNFYLFTSWRITLFCMSVGLMRPFRGLPKK